MKRRLLSFLLTFCMVLTLFHAAALAAVYDLSAGSITVSASGRGPQKVTQGEVTTVDTDPVITSTGTTSNTITVSTDDRTANITLDGADINTTGSTGIEVGDSNLDLTLKGENSIDVSDAPGIHVSGGSLNIKGSGSITVTNNDDDRYDPVSYDGAAIGSDDEENFTGSITIGGSAEVIAISDNDGAAIGSGEDGNMSGKISIGGNADVTAISDDDGAGIGSGYDGHVSGSITISGNANVVAFSREDGAGIGSGDDGNVTSSGSITITGSATVAAGSEDEGSGIGSGEDGHMKGSITISGSASVTAGSEDDGAGIGSGEDGDMSGTITITDKAKVTAVGDDLGAGIGSGSDGDMSGAITITGNARVDAASSYDGAGIGSGDDGDMSGAIIIGGNASVTAYGGSSCGASIGTGCSGTMSGSILILDNSAVTTGFVDDTTVSCSMTHRRVTVSIEPVEDASGCIGAEDIEYGDSTGSYVIGKNATINGISGSDADSLSDFITLGDNDFAVLDIQRHESGRFSIEVLEGDARVDCILYDGRESFPTSSGTYEVTCLLEMGNGDYVIVPLGTLVLLTLVGGSGSARYPVTALAAEHGTISVNPVSAASGTAVTITVTPDPGYTLETITALDADGGALTLTNRGNGVYTFRMPAGEVKVSAVFAENNALLNFFTDVFPGDYCYDAVLWAAENGIVSADPSAQFNPDALCSNGQFITFLWRAAGSPAVDFAASFTDVDQNAYYSEAVRWAASLGIVADDGLFRADDAVTREQTAVILYRFAVSLGRDVSVGEDTNILSYNDALDIAEASYPAIQWAVGAGIMQGSEGYLMPGAECNRAQIVTMLYRLLAE